MINISKKELIDWFCEYLGCHQDSIEGKCVKRFIKSKVNDEKE